ncbi:MAG TPA: helix-turn-helix domain-containing protein [Clostridia bacterium]|nr:helix-turn-helix domain-containing protein [Clostridia bacterium]
MTTTRDIGERLREARERKGLTIKQVQEDTKIRRRYIEAMEAGEFDLIPGGEVYQRGFIRTYARYLGTDERVLMEEWRLLHAPPEDLEDKGSRGERQQRGQRLDASRGHYGLRNQSTRVRRTEKEPLTDGGVVRRTAARQSMRAIRGRGVTRWGLILVVVLVLAFAAGRGFYRAVMEPGRIADETDRVGDSLEDQTLPEGEAGRNGEGVRGGGSLGAEPGGVGIVPGEIGSQTPVSSTVSRVVISEDTRTKRKYTVFGEAAEVTLLVTELTDRCWIRAVADEGRPLEKELGTGQSMDWSVKKNLRIRCGRPWAVKIVVNGKEFEPDGQESPPKDFIFEVVKEVEEENN